MDLRTAVGLCPGDVAAFTGGGGKTSLAVSLALATGSIFTTTTRIRPPAGMATVLLEEGGNLDALPEGPVCVAARRIGPDKLAGVTPAVVQTLRTLAERRGFAGRPGLPGAVLVEADGSAGLPLKAPADHEPVIPPCATLVVPVAGAAALGRPVSQMHRPDRLAAAAGVPPEAPVSPSVMRAALQACARGAPAGARLVPVVNQCDLLADLTPAREALRGFGRGVLAARGAVVGATGAVVGATGAVAAVVLAAGAARRFGSPKQVAPLHGRTLIEASLRAPLQAGLAEVVVVVGATDLSAVLAPYPVRLVENQDWADGMSTSVRMGLQALPAHIQAALFCLADQPMLPAEVVRRLAVAWQNGAQIAAPFAGGERKPPVLFDRRFWPELLAVTGDEGGRSVLRRHMDLLVQVPWEESDAFRDVDTVEDLANM